MALGAGRGRIIRQLLTESLLLATLAGAAGVALASWGVTALTAAAPPGVPRLEQASIDPLVLTFTALIVIVSAIVFGLAPAVRASRTDVQGVLKEGGRGTGGAATKDRLRTAVIVGELALALVLLIGAGLLIRSGMALERVSPDSIHRTFLPRGSRFPRPTTKNRSMCSRPSSVAAAAAAIPGVRSASLTSQVPMGPGGNGNGHRGRLISGTPSRAGLNRHTGVFRHHGHRDRPRPCADRGRSARSAEGHDRQPSLAQALFKGADPIGRRVGCCEHGPDGKTPDYKTVGVAADTLWRGPAEPPSPEFYLPAARRSRPRPGNGSSGRCTSRCARSGIHRAWSTRFEALCARGAGVPLFDARMMEQRIGSSLQTARFNTLLLTILGGLGVVLAIVGIYGVIAYFVTRRTREIGVRMALGATRRDVIALVVRQAVWPVGLGVTAGLIASLMATRLLRNQLFGIGPTIQSRLLASPSR